MSKVVCIDCGKLLNGSAEDLKVTYGLCVACKRKVDRDLAEMAMVKPSPVAEGKRGKK